MSTAAFAATGFQDDYPFLCDAIGDIVGPGFPSCQGFPNQPYDFSQWSQFDSFGGNSQFLDLNTADYELSFDDLFSVEQSLCNSQPIGSWNATFAGTALHGAGLVTDASSSSNSSSRTSSMQSSLSAGTSMSKPSQTKSQQFLDPNSKFLDANQQKAFNDLNNHLRLESSKPWTQHETEPLRMAGINDSVTLLCDLMTTVLNKYRGGKYQDSTTQGRSEANITIMMAFASISRVLKIYRSFCQMFLIDQVPVARGGGGVTESLNRRPSPRRKPSAQVHVVSQLAVAEFHLQHLSQFFHATEFVNCVHPAIIESGTRCLQDLQSTIHATVTQAREN